MAREPGAGATATLPQAPGDEPGKALQRGDGEQSATGGGSGGRAMRADARRNQDRLIDAARLVFASQGSDASMEAIARQAGVGVGTLYRHFPKRVDLVQAVYQGDVDELMRGAERAGDELDPFTALATWLESFVAYARSKKILLAELQEAWQRQPELKLQARERITGAMTAVLERAQAAGTARADITGEDLMALLGPMCTHANLSEDQGYRLVAMILDGLRRPA